jgi:hypothetical protein
VERAHRHGPGTWPHGSAATEVAPAAGSGRSPATPLLAGELLIACALSWSAGLIHVKAAIDHLDEHVAASVFFGLLAAAQLLWGIALYRRPARGLLAAGAAMSVLVVALWAMSRIGGLPLGPDRWSPEPVGALDSVASADEAVLALLAVLHLRVDRPGLSARGVPRLAAAAGMCLILLSSLLLALGAEAH